MNPTNILLFIGVITLVVIAICLIAKARRENKHMDLHEAFIKKNDELRQLQVDWHKKMDNEQEVSLSKAISVLRKDKERAAPLLGKALIAIWGSEGGIDTSGLIADKAIQNTFEALYGKGSYDKIDMDDFFDIITTLLWKKGLIEELPTSEITDVKNLAYYLLDEAKKESAKKGASQDAQDELSDERKNGIYSEGNYDFPA